MHAVHAVQAVHAMDDADDVDDVDDVHGVHGVHGVHSVPAYWLQVFGYSVRPGTLAVRHSDSPALWPGTLILQPCTPAHS